MFAICCPAVAVPVDTELSQVVPDGPDPEGKVPLVALPEETWPECKLTDDTLLDLQSFPTDTCPLALLLAEFGPETWGTDPEVESEFVRLALGDGCPDGI